LEVKVSYPIYDAGVKKVWERREANGVRRWEEQNLEVEGI
jgi:hypothetical protein